MFYKSLAMSLSAIAVVACSGGAKTKLVKVGDTVAVGKEIALKVDADFDTYRSKGLITPPYYKNCMLDSERTIIKEFEEAYITAMSEALSEEGVVINQNEDESDSILEVDLDLYANLDYASIRVFSTLNFDGKSGKLRQRDEREHGKFKTLSKMPRGLGREGRNEYCTQIWAENDQIGERVNKYMQKLSHKHLRQLKKKGVFNS